MDEGNDAQGAPTPAPGTVRVLPVIRRWDDVPQFADEWACLRFWHEHVMGEALFAGDARAYRDYLRRPDPWRPAWIASREHGKWIPPREEQERMHAAVALRR